MYYKNRLYSTQALSTVLYAHEGEDDATKAAADLQKKIDDAIATATAGLKAKNDELLGKMAATKEQLKAFDGLDPVKAKEIFAKLDQDDDAKLFSEGKKNLVIEKYTERMRASHADELNTERQKTAAEAQRADAYRGAVLDNQIRAVTTGLHKGAVEDALLHARQIFTLDAKGNAVQLDSEGRPVLGKDGKTAFNPAEWIELQRELKPHWFPATSSGSGADGSKGSGQGKTMKRAAFDNASPAERSAFFKSGGTLID